MFLIRARNLIILALISCATILLTYQISQSVYDNPPLVWTAGAMTDISMNDLPQKSKSIHLAAARGEYEAFQIVIQAPPGNLSNVDVRVSNLYRKYSDRGGVIDRDNITLYREHYLYVDRPSPSGWEKNPTRGAGWYADALIPFVEPKTGKDLTDAAIDAVPFDLEMGKNQPIWVDIFVPRDILAGEYQGTFTVDSDRGKTRGEILLTVWDFELPLKPTMNSLFDVWQNRGDSTAIEFVKHKVMPGKLRGGDNKQKLINEWGLNSVRLPYWSGANYQTCQMDPPPTTEQLKTAASPYPDDVLVYVFSVDEIDECQSLEKEIAQWGNNIHAAGIEHLAVMKPRPELYDAIDIWVVQPKMYAEAKQEIIEVMQQQDRVWFYTGHQTEYSPQWNLDSSPINFRIPQGFIAQNLGLTGVLYWQADRWTEDPWQQVYVYEQGKRNFPGDGTMIYPGKEVGIAGVVPSMRLKWIREGVEDYEYIEILKQLGLEDWALEISRSVGADWKNWTQSTQRLAKARIELGNKIEEVSS